MRLDFYRFEMSIFFIYDLTLIIVGQARSIINFPFSYANRFLVTIRFRLPHLKDLREVCDMIYVWMYVCICVCCLGSVS